MDPEMEQTAAAQLPPAPGSTPAPDGDADAGQEDGAGENGPLSKIEIEPAEDGASVITHHRKMSDRVKAMDTEETRPKKHVAKNHKDLMSHLKKHTKRLSPG
jgi:negative regulator of genetic competence, sporulation and motility